MKRGPPPMKGFDIAIPIALLRGRVMMFQLLPDHVCNFTITGNGVFALVRLMSATRLHASIEEIAWEYSGAIAGLGTLPFGGPVSRELWLYSRYKTMRFFRLTEAGLVEIDSCGFLFVNGKPVTVLPVIPAANPMRSGPVVPVPGSPLPSAPAITGPPGSRPHDPKSPIIRLLKKKKAGTKPESGKNNSAGPIESIDEVFKKGCADKKPATANNPVPASEPAAPAGKPVADSQMGLLCEGSSIIERDHVPVSGTSGGEK